MFYHEKDTKNVVTEWLNHEKMVKMKLFIMTVKSLLDVQNTNNSQFGCY